MTEKSNELTQFTSRVIWNGIVDHALAEAEYMNKMGISHMIITKPSKKYPDGHVEYIYELPKED